MTPNKLMGGGYESEDKNVLPEQDESWHELADMLGVGDGPNSEIAYEDGVFSFKFKFKNNTEDNTKKYGEWIARALAVINGGYSYGSDGNELLDFSYKTDTGYYKASIFAGNSRYSSSKEPVESAHYITPEEYRDIQNALIALEVQKKINEEAVCEMKLARAKKDLDQVLVAMSLVE